MALLVNPTNADATTAETKEMQRAAGVLGLRLLTLDATTPQEIETAFATAFPAQAGALVVGGDSFFYANRDQVIGLAARFSVPAVYSEPHFYTAAGGLMGYGASLSDALRIVLQRSS